MSFKTFMPKAKTIALPVEDLQHGLSSVTENEYISRKGIKLKMLFYHNRQTIDCLSHICAA
jgi:hypothetical protein